MLERIFDKIKNAKVGTMIQPVDYSSLFRLEVDYSPKQCIPKKPEEKDYDAKRDEMIEGRLAGVNFDELQQSEAYEIAIGKTFKKLEEAQFKFKNSETLIPMVAFNYLKNINPDEEIVIENETVDSIASKLPGPKFLQPKRQIRKMMEFAVSTFKSEYKKFAEDKTKRNEIIDKKRDSIERSVDSRISRDKSSQERSLRSYERDKTELEEIADAGYIKSTALSGEVFPESIVLSSERHNYSRFVQLRPIELTTIDQAIKSKDHNKYFVAKCKIGYSQSEDSKGSRKQLIMKKESAYFFISDSETNQKSSATMKINGNLSTFYFEDKQTVSNRTNSDKLELTLNYLIESQEDVIVGGTLSKYTNEFEIDTIMCEGTSMTYNIGLLSKVNTEKGRNAKKQGTYPSLLDLSTGQTVTIDDITKVIN